jgi:hypothetical protein
MLCDRFCGRHFFISLQKLLDYVASPLQSSFLGCAILLNPSKLDFFNCFFQLSKLFGCHCPECSDVVLKFEYSGTRGCEKELEDSRNS